MFGHVCGNVHELNAPAISAFEIFELIPQAEHHFPRDVRFVA